MSISGVWIFIPPQCGIVDFHTFPSAPWKDPLNIPKPYTGVVDYSLAKSWDAQTPPETVDGFVRDPRGPPKDAKNHHPNWDET